MEEARALYLKESCGALIGFGGGSAIDCAKAVGARIARPKTPIRSMKGILRVLRRIPLLIAVPTTAGTGSEVTLASVITDSESGHKFPINDFPLIPRVAVLDVENTRSLPPAMTATTGMDALTHAVEAYIGRSTTASTRADALEAVRLIFENLENAYEHGNNIQAREHMLTAAFLAGRSFSKSYVGYVHGLAHSLGGQYGVPHGLANAVILPYFLEEYGPACWEKLGKLAKAAGLAQEADSAQQSALAEGNSLILYEGYRPHEVQTKVLNSLSAMTRTDPEVKEAVTGAPWRISWFISGGYSNHQRGYAVDMGLAKVSETKEYTTGGYRYVRVWNYERYEMPTPIHELSRAAATYTAPVTINSTTAWKSAEMTQAMASNEPALGLQRYCTDAELTPLASEWWHFNDLSTRSQVLDNQGIGDFLISSVRSAAPA